MPDIVKDKFFEIFGGKAGSDCKNLIKSYSEPHRFYHTIHHVHDCMEKFIQIEHHLTDRYSVGIALLYHDIVYDPKADNNEEKSAKTARRVMMKYDFDTAKTDKVYEFILLTKHPSEPNSVDEQFLIDIDLSILGASPEIYKTYEENIRKEYSFVPEYLYKKGRSKLLQTFLNKKKIFKTEIFAELYEGHARNNLAAAISKLLR